MSQVSPAVLQDQDEPSESGCAVGGPDDLSES
jgi:hypothetical protein